MIDLATKSILVTGGAGFLGRYVIARLRQDRCRHISAPRSAECELMFSQAIERCLFKERPEVIIHLAARFGGIGANRQYPGTLFYHNLMMGVQLIEASRRSPIDDGGGAGAAGFDATLKNSEKPLKNRTRGKVGSLPRPIVQPATPKKRQSVLKHSC